MKSKILTALMIAGLALSSTAHAKLWLLTSLSSAAGVGLRGEVGKYTWDVSTSYINRSGFTSNAAVVPLYADIYNGNWGLAMNSTDIGAGINSFFLQYAVEHMVLKQVGLGAGLNVVEFQNLPGGGMVTSPGAGTIAVGQGSVGFFTGLNAYVIFEIGDKIELPSL